MKTKKQKTTKTENATAPAMTDAEKRTRDTVAAADLATSEAHNQRGTPAAERVHVPTAEDPGEAPEPKKAPAYARAFPGPVPVPAEITDEQNRRAYALGFRRGFGGLNIGSPAPSRHAAIVTGWKDGFRLANATPAAN